jgi:hypothetical protein
MLVNIFDEKQNCLIMFLVDLYSRIYLYFALCKSFNWWTPIVFFLGNNTSKGDSVELTVFESHRIARHHLPRGCAFIEHVTGVPPLRKYYCHQPPIGSGLIQT